MLEDEIIHKIALERTGRGFRPRQKGVACSELGCADSCVSNDLCAKHNMARRRRTEEGRAYTREYNKRYKRPDIYKVCRGCGAGYKTARANQVKCSKCPSGKKVESVIR